ncbi:uncharacterized protein LOC123011937 [Tribolium madens]|uniref:uncharacterized protein LOC123011937 n=1 Tax=Tribolium madens TaxID=41895 RepID=UPI001CF73A60|nr:uncharacterized protein LOC123011937 [Tribolium madens]
MPDSFQDVLLTFNIAHKNREIYLQLHNNDTVGDLKSEIFNKVNVPPSRQVIDCWSTNPESENDILGACCDYDINYLVMYDSDDLRENDVEMADEAINHFKEFEHSAAIDFIDYFSTNFDDKGITFHVY